MFDPMELDSGMQTLLLMQIEQRLADLERVQCGQPTLLEERVIQELVAQQPAEEPPRVPASSLSSLRGAGRR